MSKTKTTDVEQQQEVQAQPKGIADDLREKGVVTLTSATREELAEKVASLPTDCRYSAGAVGRNQNDGTYMVRLRIIKNDDENGNT